MRTNIDIDGKLMAEAMKAGGYSMGAAVLSGAVHRSGVAAWVLLVLAACGGGAGSGSGTGGGGTPNAPPVTTGSWVRSPVGTTWQWQLLGTVNTGYNVSLYDIDLFDSSTTLIANLKQAGRTVICYFSGGSYENWRADAGQFPATVLGNNLSGWAGERWLDIRASEVRTIMAARLDLAVQKGCDGVEPDNVDGYTNNPGFPLTAQDQLDYNAFLANAAHTRGLAVGLKNDLDQVSGLVDYFDFAVNEQCHEYNECDRLAPFIASGKPVFNAEYASGYVNNATDRQALCADSLARQVRTLILPLNLDDGFRLSCD